MPGKGNELTWDAKLRFQFLLMLIYVVSKAHLTAKNFEDVVTEMAELTGDTIFTKAKVNALRTQLKTLKNLNGMTKYEAYKKEKADNKTDKSYADWLNVPGNDDKTTADGGKPKFGTAEVPAKALEGYGGDIPKSIASKPEGYDQPTPPKRKTAKGAGDSDGAPKKKARKTKKGAETEDEMEDETEVKAEGDADEFF